MVPSSLENKVTKVEFSMIKSLTGPKKLQFNNQLEVKDFFSFPERPKDEA